MNNKQQLLNELRYIAKTGRDLLEPLLFYFEDSAGSPEELSQDLAGRGKDQLSLRQAQDAEYGEMGVKEGVINTRIEPGNEAKQGEIAVLNVDRSCTLEIEEGRVQFLVDRAALEWSAAEDWEPTVAASSPVPQGNPPPTEKPSTLQLPAQSEPLREVEPITRKVSIRAEIPIEQGGTDPTSEGNPLSLGLAAPDALGKEAEAPSTPKALFPPHDPADFVPFSGPVTAPAPFSPPSSQSQLSEGESMDFQGNQDEDSLKSAESPLVKAEFALPRSPSQSSAMPAELPKEVEAVPLEPDKEAFFQATKPESSTPKDLFAHREDPDSSVVILDVSTLHIAVPLPMHQSFTTDPEPNQPLFEAEPHPVITPIETGTIVQEPRPDPVVLELPAIQPIDQAEDLNTPPAGDFSEPVAQRQEYRPEKAIEKEDEAGESLNSEGNSSAIAAFEGFKDCESSSVAVSGGYWYADICEEGKYVISDANPLWPNRLGMLELSFCPSPEPVQTASPPQQAGNTAIHLEQPPQTELFEGSQAELGLASEESASEAPEKLGKSESRGSLHSEKGEIQASDQTFRDDLPLKSGNQAELSPKTAEQPAEAAPQSSSSSSLHSPRATSSLRSDTPSDQPSANFEQFPVADTLPAFQPSCLQPQVSVQSVGEARLPRAIEDTPQRPPELPNPDHSSPLLSQELPHLTPQSTEFHPQSQHSSPRASLSAALEQLGTSEVQSRTGLPVLEDSANWDKQKSEARKEPGKLMQPGESEAESSQLSSDKAQTPLPSRDKRASSPPPTDPVLHSNPNASSAPEIHTTATVKPSTPPFSPERPLFPLQNATLQRDSVLEEEKLPLQSLFPSLSEPPPLQSGQKSLSPESVDSRPASPDSAIQADMQTSEAKSGQITPADIQNSVLLEGAAALTGKSSSRSSRPAWKASTPASKSSHSSNTPPNTAIRPPSFILVPQSVHSPAFTHTLPFLSPDSEDCSPSDSARAAWTAAAHPTTTTRGVKALDLLVPGTAPSDTIERLPIKAASSSLKPGKRRAVHSKKRPAMQLSAGYVGLSGSKVVHSSKSGVAWGGWDASGLPDFPHLRTTPPHKPRTKPHRNPYEAGWSKRIMKNFFHLKMVVPPFTSLPVLTVTKLEGRTVRPSELRTVRSQGELREMQFVQSLKKPLNGI